MDFEKIVLEDSEDATEVEDAAEAVFAAVAERDEQQRANEIAAAKDLVSRFIFFPIIMILFVGAFSIYKIGKLYMI